MSDTDTTHGFDETSVEIRTDAAEPDALNNLISDCPTPDNRKKDILKELDEFFTGENEVGPEINSDLAKGLTSAFHIRISEEKIKALMKGHHRPTNCDNWTFPKTNESVWPSLKKKSQDVDVKLQKVQGIKLKGMFPLGRIFDMLLKASKAGTGLSHIDTKECLKLTKDN